MKQQSKARRTQLSVTLALMLSLLAPPGLAAEFYGIIDNFGKKLRSARMDVAVDTAPGTSEVQFEIFSEAGTPLAQFAAHTNPDGLASTATVINLVDLTVGQPMVIRARPSYNTAPASATIHVDSIGAPLTFGVWPTHRRDGPALAIGREFSIALGSFRAASILVASVGGTEQVVDVHVGTRGPDGNGVYSNPRLQVNALWRVNLSPAEAHSNLVVSSTGPVIVQVAIDDGRGFQSFQVIPSIN